MQFAENIKFNSLPKLRPKTNNNAHVCIGKRKDKVSESLKKQFRGVAQLGSAGALGALGRRFESCRPDQ